MKIRKLIVVAVALSTSWIAIAEDAAQRAVLVTGASSGSGRVIAETLADRGYFVYAGARKQSDMDDLNKIDNIQAVRLDVTVQSDIDAAVETIQNEGRGLYGLVNNAGVGLMGPLIETTESDLEFLFDVNVYGPFRVTKAFAPMIIESKGAITSTGSVAGFISGLFYGPYSMSKHALEAFTDSLAAEMEKFDVRVSIIDPGGFNSNIGKTIYKRMQDAGFNADESLYTEEWEENWLLQTEGEIAIDNDVPKEIANAVIDTLESDKPQRRYMVVGTRGAAERAVGTAMKEMLQLNQGHQHSLGREELIAMMDEMLEQ